MPLEPKFQPPLGTGKLSQVLCKSSTSLNWSALSIFFSLPPDLQLLRRSFTEPDAHKLARLAGQKTPETLLSPLILCSVTNACNRTQQYHMGAEDPTSAPDNFMAGIVTNSSLQPAIASFLVYICV